MSKLTKGDYVVATKYSDGDPQDQFCIGIFEGMEHDRFIVLDDDNKRFRASGFRRARKVRQDVGGKLVDIIPEISDKPGRSIWSWVRQFERDLTPPSVDKVK